MTVGDTFFPFTFPGTFGEEPEIPPVIIPPGAPPIADEYVAPNISGDSPAEPIAGRMACTLSTRRGEVVWQWLPDQMTSLQWGRSLSQISKCTLTVPTASMPSLSQLRPAPWYHQLTVWDERARLLWTGPVQGRDTGKNTAILKASDMSAWALKTRVPLTKRWDSTLPAAIARELFELMIEHHDLQQTPLVRIDPLGEAVQFETLRDEQMLDITLGELVKVGLKWAVTNGVPVLGPLPRQPFVALSEQHFIDSDLRLICDGSQTTNNVLVRGPDGNYGRSRVAMVGDMDLQSLVTLDNISGASSIDRASRRYTRHYSQYREAVSANGPVQLRDDAPVTIDQLIPSARLSVEAFDRLTVMELDTVDVHQTVEGVKVSVTLESVSDDLPELSPVSVTGSGI